MVARRRFIGIALFGVVGAPSAILAQDSSRVYTIACIVPLRRPDVDASSADIMIERLRALGWLEGRNLKVEYRSAENQPERYDDLAREVVALKVDLIVAVSVNAVTAAKNATSSIPIVMVNTADPVKFGLVASLARPGGNVTGVALPAIDWGKWLELAHQAIAGLSRIAVIGNPDNRVYADYVAQNKAAAARLGLQLLMVPVAHADQFDEAFAAIKRQRADALVVGPDPLYVLRLREISDRAMAIRVPLLGPNRQAAELGALLGYGFDYRNGWRGAAPYVDRILKGAKPRDLPIEQPAKFELVVNMITAKALGIAIPQAVIVRADDVIQ